MKLLASLLLTLTAFVGVASAQYGNYDASSSVGQNNVAYQAAPKSNYASGGYYQYVTRCYYRCGRKYCYYEPVWVAGQANYQSQPQTTNVNNPIGAVNTDNSVTYQYTYNITHAQMPYPQGSSVLGYPGLTSAAEVYGNMDLATNLDTFQRAVAQNSSDGQALLGKLGDTFNHIAAHQKDLAAAAIQAQAMTAMAVADVEKTKAQATLAASMKADGSSGLQVNQAFKIEQGGGATKVEPDPSNPNPTVPPLPTDNLGQIQQMFNLRCVSCHGGNTPKGGLNLEDAKRLTAVQVDSVLTRVTHSDPAKRMPLTAEGKPGEPLPMHELKLLFKSSQ